MEATEAFHLTSTSIVSQGDLHFTLSHWVRIISFLSLGFWFSLSVHLRPGCNFFLLCFFPRIHDEIIQNQYIKKMMIHKTEAHSTNNKNR